MLSSALGLFVVLSLGGIRESNALLRPSYTPLEAALYNRLAHQSAILGIQVNLRLSQPLQSGLVPLPVVGDRGLRAWPRGRRGGGAVVGAVLAAGQDVLPGLPAAPAAHLARGVALHSPR